MKPRQVLACIIIDIMFEKLTDIFTSFFRLQRNYFFDSLQKKYAVLV